jgi:hypothetical protein
MLLKEGHIFLKRRTNHGTSPMSSFFYHLNGKTKSNKMAPRGVLTKKEDATMIAWTLAM